SSKGSSSLLVASSYIPSGPASVPQFSPTSYRCWGCSEPSPFSFPSSSSLLASPPHSKREQRTSPLPRATSSPAKPSCTRAHPTSLPSSHTRSVTKQLPSVCSPCARTSLNRRSSPPRWVTGRWLLGSECSAFSHFISVSARLMGTRITSFHKWPRTTCRPCFSQSSF